MEERSQKTTVPLEAVLRPPCALYSQIRQELVDSSACQADTITQRRASVATPRKTLFWNEENQYRRAEQTGRNYEVGLVYKLNNKGL